MESNCLLTLIPNPLDLLSSMDGVWAIKLQKMTKSTIEVDDCRGLFFFIPLSKVSFLHPNTPTQFYSVFTRSRPAVIFFPTYSLLEVLDHLMHLFFANFTLDFLFIVIKIRLN